MFPPTDPEFVANMVCTVFCAANLLNHINLHNFSQMIIRAMANALKETDYIKKDLRGQFKIREFTDSIIFNLKSAVEK